MATGFFIDPDGLIRQYGLQKTIPEIGGDYLVYGSTREIEQLIPLVPFQVSNNNVPVPAPPTSFNGGTQSTPPTSAIQAGIQSLTNLIPLQQTVPNTTNLVFTAPQIFIESAEVETLVSAAVSGAPTAANISVGLVTVQPGNLVAPVAPGGGGLSTQVPSTFFQVLPSSPLGAQILNAFPIVSASAVTPQATTGSRTLYTGTNGFTFAGGSGTDAAVTGGGGLWIGIQMPQVTSAIGINPNGGNILPQNAYLSTIVSFTGGTNPAFTNGLFKLRLRYTIFGGTSY